MSYPYHHSTGQPDPHNNNPSFYGSQTSYQYQQQRGGDLDMNMAYGHHGYNNTDNVANMSDEFSCDMNGNNDNYAQDTKEDVAANPEEGNVGYASVMDILSQLNETDGNIPENSTNGEPPAVPPFSSGERFRKTGRIRATNGVGEWETASI